MNGIFHKNCENTGKILKISCARCNFVKFDIHFLNYSNTRFWSTENQNYSISCWIPCQGLSIFSETYAKLSVGRMNLSFD